MSENNQKSFDFNCVVRSAGKLFLYFLVLVALISALGSFLLLATGEPERYYNVLSYVIIAISSYLASRIFIRHTPAALYESLMTSLFVIVFLLAASMVFDNESFGVFDALTKSALVLIPGILGLFLRNSKKTRKKVKNRK